MCPAVSNDTGFVMSVYVPPRNDPDRELFSNGDPYHLAKCSRDKCLFLANRINFICALNISSYAWPLTTSVCSWNDERKVQGDSEFGTQL
jgi:hypothetical protein